MTASEFTFLALGLGLGVVAGAALVEVLRARPPAPREVRVTVSTDAVPRRRGSTLSDDAFTLIGPEPARGGPADRRGPEPGLSVSEIERRTAVLSRVSTQDVASGAPAAGPFPGRELEPQFQLADPPLESTMTAPVERVPSQRPGAERTLLERTLAERGDEDRTADGPPHAPEWWERPR